MSKTNYPHLLPPNATALERALSGPTGRITNVPVEISKVFRWDTCPFELLPWLAWETSVDLWDDAWSEERKREIIRDTYLLHQLKGTLGGIKRYVGYTDASVERAIVPPQSPYWAPLDQASIANWEATLPQIRIYPRREPGIADGFYYDADYLDDDGVVHGAYYEKNRAPEDGGERKVLYDPETQTETEINWIGAVHPTYGTHTELGLPGTAANDHLYCDEDFIDNGYYPSERDTHANVVALPPLPPEEIRNGWYRVTRDTPDFIDTEGSAGNGHLYYRDGHYDDGPDNALDGDYYAGNEAPWQVYRRWFIYSPDASPGDPDGWSYYDNFRYGMPPHTAEIWIDIPETADLDESYDNLGHYYGTTDLSRLWKTADAIDLSKSARDQILLETELMRPATFGDRRTFGSIKFGEYLRSTHSNRGAARLAGNYFPNKSRATQWDICPISQFDKNFNDNFC